MLAISRIAMGGALAIEYRLKHQDSVPKGPIAMVDFTHAPPHMTIWYGQS